MHLLLSWSTGKDSAWALHTLRQTPGVDVVGLVTTVNVAAQRVAMHGVRRSLLDAQAVAVGLPLHVVELPWPCTDAEYEAATDAFFAHARAEGVEGVAFGDLFLEDVQAYRAQQMARVGLAPVFPLWGLETATLARTMLGAGLGAVVTCVDPRVLPPSAAGRAFDERFLADLPDGADRCGESGEFHTFVYDGPMFTHPVPVVTGDTVERDGFVYADVLPAPGPGCA